MMKRASFALAAVLGASIVAAIALAGCGKKGSPVPPEEGAPSAIKSVNVSGLVTGVNFAWQAPETTAEGDDEPELAGFYLYRSDVIKGERPDFEEIAAIDLLASPDQKNFIYLDKDVLPGKSYDYQIRAVNVDQIESPPGKTIRVTYLGESSVIEGL
jgi:hypothetical protein